MAIKPVSVSQLNNYVKRILETDPLLGNVSVEGEISNLKYHGSGHVFLTLKDEHSRLSCFLSFTYAEKIRYELSEGMLVTAIGYLSLYQKGGTYSLNIKDIKVEGRGALAIAFEALKKKLYEEGLFDEKHKQKIPFFPKRIGVVTSQTGAVLQDIIKIIRTRNKIVEIAVFSCLVQGDYAAEEIAKAIKDANNFYPEIDLLIVGRGGGSIEELWPFNEERVVRKIFSSKIPIISAVGHETDYTLSDYAADIRAATPTEAAHIAAPDIEKLNMKVDEITLELFNLIHNGIDIKKLKIEQYKVEELQNEVHHSIKLNQMKIKGLARELFYNYKEKHISASKDLEVLLKELESYSPHSIMDKGYTLVLNEKGEIIKSLETLEPGDLLTIIHKDGKIITSVRKIEV